MRRRRFILSVVAALYFGAIAGMAFVPGSATNRAAWYWPFAAFVPVGVLLLLLLGRRRWWAAIAFGMLGAAWIEAAQSVWMPVGYAAAMDVVWGSAGATVGVLIALAATAPRRPSTRSHEPHRIVTQAGNREIPQD
jgi:peptidoglycan/LPS O-acetylase OafA/YrhL